MKLAAGNIKKNGQTYLPYIITCILMIAMYYIMYSLSINEGMNEMYGGYVIIEILDYGRIIVGIFAAVFLFYTNSFLMRRRKKEIGLWNILGMEKRHILKVVAIETVYIALIALVFGILAGILFEKLMYLLILRVMDMEITLGFHIYGKAVLSSVILFAVIFAAIFVKSVFSVSLSKPIELLHGSETGEREPKTKWMLAILGGIALAAGYALSILTKSPMQALSAMFLAILLVIIGTYFLFTAGSIVWLKLLRRNKKYYYQSRHFTTVSGMLYRMKRNAVGLANICILSTMVLVMISTTTSLLAGMEDSIANRYPYDVSLEIMNQEHTDSELDALLKQDIGTQGLTAEDSIQYSYMSFVCIADGMEFTAYSDGRNDMSDIKLLNFFVLDDYNRITGNHQELGEDEFLFFGSGEDYDYDTIRLMEREFRVTEGEKKSILLPRVPTYEVYNFAVRDFDVLHELQGYIGGNEAAGIHACYGYQLNGSEEQQMAVADLMEQQLSEQGYEASVVSSAYKKKDYLSMYGGLFFLGVFLGLVFLVATILIIYYKQISEGFEDKERFEIMQKVGMSQAEVKQSIRSQILMVFFLPLLTAGIHMIFAFPLMSRLLGLLGLSNNSLFVICALICFVVFGIFYGIVYLLTAKVYYRIVRR